MKNTIKEVYMYALGALIVLGIMTLVGILMFKSIPVENKDLLIAVIGAIVGSFITVVSYFYGSSKGSADKNDLLNGK